MSLLTSAATRAYIALGSNLGDSRDILRRAMDRLQELSDAPLMRSSFYETVPVDCPPGSPNFLNAVVGLVPRAGETPESLLTKMQALEQEFGRRPKKVLNEARSLDLDLIAFGAETRNTPQLVLPHPRAQQRRFVLEPLSEIAPDFILPGQTRTVGELLGVGAIKRAADKANTLRKVNRDMKDWEALPTECDRPGRSGPAGP